MEPDYTRLLNASSVSDDGDLFVGLYAELKMIAALLEVNEKTVHRHWALAKVWLYQQINDSF
jgi:hypothetical protein